MALAEKEKKKNLVPNSIHTRPGQENPKKNSKKIQKTEKPHSGIIFSQNGMRQIEKERKKFQSRIPFLPFPGFHFQKKQRKIHKIKKHHSDAISIQNVMRQSEKGRKKFQSRISFLPLSGFHFQKTYQKIHKTKKRHSDAISIQTGMRKAMKERKKFQSRIPVHTRPRQENFVKNIKKKIKILKKLFPTLFLAKTG